MSRFLLILFLIKVVTFCSAQCSGRIFLISQEDIDSFPIKHNYCSEFDTIYIRKGIKFYNNLDSLKYLKKGKWLSIDNADSLTSISGLNNLEKVGYFFASLKNVYPKLEKLDSVEVMDYSNSHPDADLTVISNVRYIGTKLRIGRVPNFFGLKEFTSSKRFIITLHQLKNKQNFKKILPSNIRNLYKLFIFSCDSISLEGLEHIDSIYSLELNACNYLERNVFAQKKGIKRMRIFGMKQANYFDALPQIDSLEYLDFQFRWGKLEKTFPNLKHVSEFLRISHHDSLQTLDFLKDFDIPKGKRIRVDLENLNDLPYHIIIDGNKNLKACNNPFLCKALEAYPDSVIVSNAGDCNLNFLKDNCESVGTETANEFTMPVIYPNPVRGELNIIGGHQIVKCQVYDIHGRPVMVQDNKANLEVNHLSSGVYILDIWDGKRHHYRKFVKE